MIARPRHLVVATLVLTLAACGSNAGSTTKASTPEETPATGPSATAAPPTSTKPTGTPPASAAPAASAASAAPAASAVPSGPCVEVGELADLGEPVVIAMTGITSALDATKVDDARALVKTATKGLTAMADRVGPASPTAKALFTKAASELTAAAAAFPGGSELLEQSRTDLDHAFALGEAVRCPS